ncbi:MAG: hypothetical protein Q7S40_21640 [Opitutaceae bacterium]|nr:hypothetical protein [Opitutaceae bacterium]
MKAIWDRNPEPETQNRRAERGRARPLQLADFRGDVFFHHAFPRVAGSLVILKSCTS